MWSSYLNKALKSLFNKSNGMKLVFNAHDTTSIVDFTWAITYTALNCINYRELNKNTINIIFRSQHAQRHRTALRVNSDFQTFYLLAVRTLSRKQSHETPCYVPTWQAYQTRIYQKRNSLSIPSFLVGSV